MKRMHYFIFWYLALLLGVGLSAAGISDQFLDRLAWLETRNRFLVGDGGKARGVFQFHRATWSEVTRLRRKAGLATTDYQAGTACVTWSRRYARSYLLWLEQNLLQHFGYCSEQLVYASYNAGLGRVKALNGKLQRLPAVARRAKQFSGQLYFGQ